MRSAGALVLAAVLCTASLAGEADGFRIPRRSVSQTEQFTVYCDDNPVRFAVVSFAEELKRGFLKALREKDDWKYPIVIQLVPPPTTSPNFPKSTVQIYQTEMGFKVQVDVALKGNLAEAKFPQQLLRAILLEYMHRANPRIQDGTPYAEPPRWLIDGLVQHIQGGPSDAELDVYKAAMGSGRPMPLHDFFAQDTTNLDSTSESFYRAYSYALLEMLLSQPNGVACMVNYLHALPQHLGDGALNGLEGSFPALAGDSATVEKWWTVNLAKLAATDRFRGYNVKETEQHLVEALQVNLPAGKGETKQVDLTHFNDFVKKPEGKFALDAIVGQLVALQARAHASYRPILEGYLESVGLLIRGKTKGVEQRLAALEEERKKTLKRLDDIADYMNWFELTQTSIYSNQFQGYLKAADALKKQEAPKRNDAITKYLDEVEKLMAE